jgi:hypothetical protein
MHATLPKALLAQEIKKRIEDMEEGEEGSTMPYAMAADGEDHLWLDPGALVTLNHQGDFSVQKTEDGYVVTVHHCPYRWERGEVDNTGNWDRYKIPVAKINVIIETQIGNCVLGNSDHQD